MSLGDAKVQAVFELLTTRDDREIRHCFRRWHPDKHQEYAQQATEIFKVLQKARPLTRIPHSSAVRVWLQKVRDKSLDGAVLPFE